MQKTMNIIFKVFAIIVHIFQSLVSGAANLNFSLVIAATLIGMYVFDLKTFKKLFLVPRWVASCVGNVVWLILAVIEIPIEQ